MRSAVLLVLLLTGAAVAAAQTPSADTAPSKTVCDLPIPTPAAEPPPGSGPVVFQLVPCFSQQGNVSMVEPQTYLYYIHTRTSLPSQRRWVPYDETAVASILEDFKRLWDTGFLDNLTVDVQDYRFSNGTIGKLVVYQMEERQRIKIVRYEGSKHVETTKLEEKMKELNIKVALDTFVDQSQIGKIKGLIADMLAAQGYGSPTITSDLQPVEGGPKLVNLIFKIDDGPRTQLRKIVFDGNTAFSTRTLTGVMKQNQTKHLLWVPRFDATYKEAGFDEDAERLVQFYHDHGFVGAQVGEPALKPISAEASASHSANWVEMHVPITEGKRYRIGDVKLEGVTALKQDALLELFKLRRGEIYDESNIREGLKKARDVYGSLGRFEMTGYPDLTPHDDPNGESTVDVTLRVQEGDEYRINRLIFTGNTITKDNVIRREMRVYEGGVFNSEALKFSVRRLNQLGYFKPIDEQKNVEVKKVPSDKDKVDVTVKLEEQNRNQISFGAGMSETTGVFLNGSFATTNFLGKGETLSLTAEQGYRSNDYEAGLTEPYVFNRPISLGASLFSRKYDYYLYSAKPSYSEVREGISVTGGTGLRAFTRLFGGYAYEVIDAKSAPLSSSATASSALASSTLASATSTSIGSSTTKKNTAAVPTFAYAIDDGRHIESRIEPQIVYDTVDNPFAPRRGMRLTLGSRVAGGPMGGTVSYLRPEAEAIVYIPTTKRTAFGIRGQAGILEPYGVTEKLPYYLRYFMGGENEIRGVDLRTVGPVDSSNQLIGGNKMLLFNAEYYFDIAPKVRALAFHDAGQTWDESHPFNLRELRTSTGAELRVVVPMFNVPFRLIYAWNLYRDPFQPAHAFKFAVGSTF